MSEQAACTNCGSMTAAQLKDLVRSAMREEFTACGLLSTTDEQKVEMQEDFSFLRRIRKLYEETVNKVGSAVIIGLLGAIVGFVVLGFNFKYGK